MSFCRMVCLFSISERVSDSNFKPCSMVAILDSKAASFLSVSSTFRDISKTDFSIESGVKL